jgi:hypothetical protein
VTCGSNVEKLNYTDSATAAAGDDEQDAGAGRVLVLQAVPLQHTPQPYTPADHADTPSAVS